MIEKETLSLTAGYGIAVCARIGECSADMAADRELGVPLRQNEHSFQTGSRDRLEIVMWATKGSHGF
jgi:hypothetical protein